MIPYQIIASGSSGNATLLNNHVLVDCGVSAKALKPYYRQIGAVLLTHEHGDHFNKSTVRWLAENRPGLRFGCCDYLVRRLLEAGVSAQKIDVLTPEHSAEYSTFTVRPFLVTHDVPNCGYRLLFKADNSKVFYVTDCANLNGIDAKNYDLYLIEGNHKTEEIDERIAEKKENGEYAYEIRAKRMHLSEEDANDWLIRNMGENSAFVYMHRHKEKTDGRSQVDQDSN